MPGSSEEGDSAAALSASNGVAGGDGGGGEDVATASPRSASDGDDDSVEEMAPASTPTHTPTPDLHERPPLAPDLLHERDDDHELPDLRGDGADGGDLGEGGDSGEGSRGPPEGAVRLRAPRELLAAAAAAAAAWRVRRLPLVRRPGAGGATPHRLLGAAAHLGLLLHGVFGALVGAAGLVEGADDALRGRHALLLAVSLLQVAQAAAQAGLLAEARARGCVTRAQLAQRPGRQALTCLLGANAALWALDTFVAQSWAAQELQLRFFGVLVWGVISRIALPLVAFYRFHGCVLLLDVWRRAYRPPACGGDAAAVPPPLGAGN